MTDHPRRQSPTDADQVGASLGWSSIIEITDRLARAAAADGPPEVIVGILRGGMIPATLLAHALRLRDLRAIDVTHTDSDSVNARKIRRPVLRNPVSLGNLAGGDVLVVDDVAGSGDTIATTAELTRAAGAARVRTAVCAVNEINWRRERHRDPDDLLSYIGARFPGWVIFPWEKP